MIEGNKRLYLVCSVSLAILATIGCTITDYSVTPSQAEWSLPLLHGNIQVLNLVKQTATDAEVLVQSDGSILLRYKGNTLTKTKKEIFTPVQSGGLPVPMTDTITSVTLPIVGNVNIKKAILANGNYWFSYAHNRSENIKLDLFVPEMKKNGQILQHLVEVAYKGSNPTFGSTDRFSLNDIEMTPANNKINLRYIGTNDMRQRFKISTLFFQFDQLDFKYVQGFIGQNIYDLKRDSIRIDLYDSFIPGALVVDDPKMIMTVSNTFGFPSKAVINEFVVQTASGNIPFTSTLFDKGLFFNYPVLSESGQSKTSTFVFDKSNSNIKDVLNAQGQRVIYDIDALSNPAKTEDSTYFILDDAKVEVNVVVEIPLRIKVNQYPAEKTFDIEAQNLSKLKEGSLVIETTNSIPMNANAQFYLLQANEQIIDSVFTSPSLMFKEAMTNDSGISTNASIHTLTIPVPSDRISLWSTARKMRVKSWFNTPNNRNNILLSAKDEMKIRMAFVGKLK